MPRHTFVSRAKGPRVIRPLEGPARTLQPGQQITTEVAESHLAYLQAGRDFKISEVSDQAAPAPPAPPNPIPTSDLDDPTSEAWEAMTDEDVLAGFRAFVGGEPEEGATRDAMKAAIIAAFAAVNAPSPSPNFDTMTDDELRQVVASKEGRQPHPATSREKLLAKAKGE
jgi:hypothetical protein